MLKTEQVLRVSLTSSYEVFPFEGLTRPPRQVCCGLKVNAGLAPKEGRRNNSLATLFAVFCSLSLLWERDLGEVDNFQVKKLALARNGAQGCLDEEKVGD